MAKQSVPVMKMAPSNAAGVVVASVPALPASPVQATSDDHLIQLWLHERSRHTVRAYEADARAFLSHAAKPLQAVTLGDVQAYGGSLVHLATATRARRLGAVKSLVAFGHRLGYLAFNVGASIRLPAIKATLAERIIGEGDVLALLALERQPRDKALLSLLYRGGLRISEAVGLRWRDLALRSDEGGQITVFGKGGKTRTVLLSAKTWSLLETIRPNTAASDAPVFLSREGNPLSPQQAHNVVKRAAARAGISPALSAHWLRHAHASHSLDRGAKIHVVQATLGHSNVATTSRYLHARPTESSSLFLPE
ncbi:tyrosine-type recombinase/integrase [Muricoccus aerilatus]|uniref:tyrosine-type recombinase/integrase n=1 Tax=Muricoccus aerilatus TaxID=452982 RepID=UPI001FDF69BE|nr:tyrosine-type recombinase/integrase [Roseomonas aerilata]